MATIPETSQWTLNSLHTYMLAMLDERSRQHTLELSYAEKAAADALIAAKLAVTKAKAATEKRFESMNEFRQTLTDQASTFITRAEAEMAITGKSARIQDLTNRLNLSEGRGSGLNAGWVYLVGSLGVIATISSMYFALHR